MAEKICGIYKITNTVTGYFYIGSSKDVKHRFAVHKCQSKWNECPNKQMYQDMQKYGVDKFVFEVLEVVEEDKLKEKEQRFIETLNPTYNQVNAKGLNVARRKEYQKSDKCKQYHKEYHKEYDNQLCFYNGEILTLNALRKRFCRAGIPHPVLEAKKYLLKQ